MNNNNKNNNKRTFALTRIEVWFGLWFFFWGTWYFQNIF